MLYEASRSQRRTLLRSCPLATEQARIVIISQMESMERQKASVCHVPHGVTKITPAVKLTRLRARAPYRQRDSVHRHVLVPAC